MNLFFYVVFDDCIHLLDIYSVWNRGNIVHKLHGHLKLSQPGITGIMYLLQLPWWYHLGLFLLK